MFFVVLGLGWHAFAIANMILLAPYDRKWEGFYLGLLLGPIGLVIGLILRENLRQRASGDAAPQAPNRSDHSL